MDRIELHDVEYGDCTVLVGRDQSVLMVDCGSVSQYVRRDNVDIHLRFDAIFRRYTSASARYFLLTHYHRDHMNGFLWMLRQDPRYFDWVFLPAIPYADRRCPMLEMALYAHFFSAPQSDFAQVNTTCLTIYELLHSTVGAERICTLRAGDSFVFDGTAYEVLSPGADFVYDPRLFEAVDALQSVLQQIPAAADFLHLKDACLEAYAACQLAFSPSAPRAGRAAALERLSALWNELEALRGTPALQAGENAVREILQAPALRNLYTETQNDLSLVFHNRRPAPGGLDILLPGDVSGAVLNSLASKLYDSYYAVKAPHHGTESHWSDTLGRMEIAHLLISNGEYHAGSDISGRYIAMENLRHCTNPSACGWFRENDSCCNRLTRCYEQPAAGDLTLKCPAAAGNRRTPCNIYVFGHNGVRGCHCDR